MQMNKLGTGEKLHPPMSDWGSTKSVVSLGLVLSSVPVCHSLDLGPTPSGHPILCENGASLLNHSFTMAFLG